MTKSLYYSSLNGKYRRARKDLNTQEINDELHNLNLKEELNKDNALLNTAATKAQIQSTRDRLEALKILNPNAEEKLRKKARKEAEYALLKDTFKENLKETPLTSPMHLSKFSPGDIKKIESNKTTKKDLESFIKKYNLSGDIITAGKKIKTIQKEIRNKYLK